MTVPRNRSAEQWLGAVLAYVGIADPRRFLECRTCHDIGHLESASGAEDVCPTCEGGIWRERESWRWFFHRQPWSGWRIDLVYHRLPRIYRDREA